jgi:anti-sigma factor RsiW
MENWLDGELTGDERAGLARHLAACPGCARYFAQRRAMGAALKKTLHEMSAGLHFQPRPLSAPPLEKRPAWRPWLGFAPRAITALAAVLIVALLFFFHPWTKTQPASFAGKPPARVITVSDSLNIAEEAFITGCYADVCYSIDMQVSDMTINDHS